MRYSLEKPKPLHLLYGKPTHCHWCTGLLKGLREIYKENHRERHYCSQECLREGEERAAQYAIAGSRLQSHWYVAVAGMLAVFMIAFASTPRGKAQDQAEHQQAGHHHPFHKDFYSKWKVPGDPNASCCNARIEQDGKETGDCEPAKTEVRNGSWYVWIRQVKKWERVYDTQIVRDPNPNIFDAHVCWTQPRGIICFKPPDTGG